MQKKTLVHPPIELTASRSALDRLLAPISGWAVEGLEVKGSLKGMVWLRAADGTDLAVGSDSRDIIPYFEVFPIAVVTQQELRAKIESWTPPKDADQLPEPLRSALLTRPAVPEAPPILRPWDYAPGDVHVLRRTEWIIKEVTPPRTFGDYQNTQGWGRRIPPDASDACEVAVGLLFLGPRGRLLITNGEMPLDLLVTNDQKMIDAALADVRSTALEEYMRTALL